MRSKLLNAALGLGIVCGSVLAGAPAQAACTNTVINGVTVCVPNSDGGVVGGGTGAVGGGSGTGTPGQAAPIAPSLDTAMNTVAVKYGLGPALGPVRTGLITGGAYRQYQRGVVVYSPATGAQVSRGAIRAAYAKVGYEKGRLGYPTTGEMSTAAGTYQLYQGGTIAWTAQGGAHVVVGAIRTKWQATGGVTGALGAPMSDETTGLRADGASQSFGGGAIVWSSFTGAQVSKGAIRSAWLKSGAQNGSLGYPTTGEFTSPDGRTTQGFQHGRISWTATTGPEVIPGTPQTAS